MNVLGISGSQVDAGAALAVDGELARGWRSGAAAAIRRLRAARPGPEFTEHDIKNTLDNCRLDYVYEPNWARLLPRVSAMLSSGKLVAWFQGGTPFGRQSLGGRSVLCDPSDRYARENINRFFKHRPVDYPLTLSMSVESARDCLDAPVDSPYAPTRIRIDERWRDRLRSALDPEMNALVHTVARDQARELWDLLEFHRRQSGVPGLINTNLKAPGESTACTPRDAVRTMFSSPIDVLVMGRFLLMKDYWLLRSAQGAETPAGRVTRYP